MTGKFETCNKSPLLIPIDFPFPQTQEPTANSYVLLAFSYFDSCHCGFLLAEDFNRLLNACGYSLSKKVLSAFLGTTNKIRYRQFREPVEMLDFSRLNALPAFGGLPSSTESATSQQSVSPVFSKDGSLYDVLKLIEQSERDERIKAELHDRSKLADDRIRKKAFFFVLIGHFYPAPLFNSPS